MGASPHSGPDRAGLRAVPAVCPRASALVSDEAALGFGSRTPTESRPHGNDDRIPDHTAPRQSWQFGRIYTPDDAWLATAPPEPILDPDLPIVDPHHHLWLRGGHRYLLDELLADLNTGHNIVATVFEECRSMYRGDGPVEMRAVGETEFVAGIAAMSAAGNYGQDSGCGRHRRRCRPDPGRAGRAGSLLAQCAPAAGRFRGVRHSAGWDGDPVIGNSRPDKRRSSTPGRISVRASRGSPRWASASTPGSITRSSPMWSTWRGPFRRRRSSWVMSAGCSATAPMPANRPRSWPRGSAR